VTTSAETKSAAAKTYNAASDSTTILQLARAKARRCGFTHVEFRTGDPLDLGLPEAGFDAVRWMFHSAGIEVQEVLAENITQALSSPEGWWPMVLGTGYRGTIEELDPEDRERVRRSNLDFIRDTGVTSVETNVIYAVATKG
jgi:hypothetical protein